MLPAIYKNKIKLWTYFIWVICQGNRSNLILFNIMCYNTKIKTEIKINKKYIDILKQLIKWQNMQQNEKGKQYENGK